MLWSWLFRAMPKTALVPPTMEKKSPARRRPSCRLFFSSPCTCMNCLVTAIQGRPVTGHLEVLVVEHPISIHKEDLGHEAGVLLLQPLHRIHQEGHPSEDQEAQQVGGQQPNYAAFLTHYFELRVTEHHQ